MKNATTDIIFPQELSDGLLELFKEDEAQFNRLSSPLSNVNFNEGDEN
jgi:hypothetical protein